jgi:uncharacterized protein (DUF305 family)
MFLEMMVRHHEGAIRMGAEEIEQGESELAIAMARAVVTAQRAEIAELQNMLAEM